MRPEIDAYLREHGDMHNSDEIRGVGTVLIGLVLVPVFGALMFGTCIAAANRAA